MSSPDTRDPGKTGSNKEHLSIFRWREGTFFLGAAVFRKAIYFLAGSMGACGLAYEYTFSKLSSDLLGNSPRQWALVIGVMMFSMGMGSLWQRRLSDRRLLEKFFIQENILSLLGGFGPFLLVWVFGEYRDHYVLTQYTLTAAVGFIIGLEIPVMTRVNERFTHPLKANVGKIIGSDYLGAFFGMIVWVFFFLPYMTIMETAILIALFNLSAALIFFLIFFRFSTWRWIALCISLSLSSLVLLVYGYMNVPDWSRRLEQKLFHDPIVYTATTPYQHIVMTRSSAGELFCYLNGHLQFSSFDEHIYHEFLIHPAMHLAPRRKNILILGGGDGLALREVLKYPGIGRVTLIDIDPHIVGLARTNGYLVEMNRGSLDHAKVQVIENGVLVPIGEQREISLPDRSHFPYRGGRIVAEVAVAHLDALRFLGQIQGYYDVVVLDFPDPHSADLAKLYSLSFYRQLKKKLSPGAIVIQQATSPFFAKEVFLCIGRTYREAGFSTVPIRQNIPSFGEWGWWIAGDANHYSEAYLRRKIEAVRLSVPTRFLDEATLKASLVFGKGMLSSSFQTTNTLFNHLVYLYYRQAADRYR